MKILARSRFVLILTIMFMVMVPNAFATTPSSSNYSRPSIKEIIVTCPSDHASTPEGCVPNECAFGSVQSVDARTGDLVFNDGHHVVVPAHCMIGSPVVSQVTVYSDGSTTTSTVSRSTLVAPFPTNGWVEDTHYSNCFLWSCNKFTAFSGYWTVPNNPDILGGQTIFLFIGTEDYYQGQILQPVLQWGRSCAGGGNYWTIASWFVWGSSCSSTQVTGLHGVNIGDTLFGSITDVGNYHFSIVTQDINCGSSCTETETVTANAQYNAYVTLEAYNVNDCAEYPQSGSTYFSSLIISGGTPGWQNDFPNKDCNNLDHISSTGGNPSTVTLYY